MTDWLAQQARTRPDAPALVGERRTLGYRQLAAFAARGARDLAGAGIGPGAVVAWQADAGIRALCWLHAVLWRGATLAPVSADTAPQRLAGLTERIRPAAVIAAEPRSAPWNRVDARRIGFAASPSGEASANPTPASDPERVLTLVRTSGSGGEAKLVPLRARQHAASIGAITDRLGLGASDRWLLCMPLDHVGGLAILLRAAATGAAVVLHRDFDAARVARALVDERITHVSLVPTMLARILETLDGRPSDALRCVLVGGAPADPALLMQARARGLPVAPTWGMTEAASQLATPDPREAAGLDFETSPGVSGRPLNGVEIQPADGREGQLRVRAPMLFDGYLDTPGGPDADGWFATGDRGFVDAKGRVHVTGRSADRIISGGENVDAVAVARALRASGLVDEVCVLGLPDTEWGQRVAAVFVADRDAADLDAWARAHLAPAERPRVWKRVEALPRTSAGKPDRAALLRLLATGSP